MMRGFVHPYPFLANLVFVNLPCLLFGNIYSMNFTQILQQSVSLCPAVASYRNLLRSSVWQEIETILLEFIMTIACFGLQIYFLYLPCNHDEII